MRSNSLAVSNILHRVLSKQTNILYDISNSIYDHILSSATPECNYYYRTDSTGINISENLHCLSRHQEDLYEYDIWMLNSTQEVMQNFQQIIDPHINPVIIQTLPKPNHIKKEDLLLINERLKAIPKLFYEKECMDSWHLENSELIPIGISTDLFANHLPYQERNKDILMIGESKNPLIQQTSAHFAQNNLKCDIFKDFIKKRPTEISNLLNHYKIVIDFSNSLGHALISLACGCHVISLCHYDNNPYVKYAKSLQEIPIIIKNVFNNNPHDKTEIVDYLNHQFSYHTFKTKISKIITSQKRKAFYL